MLNTPRKQFSLETVEADLKVTENGVLIEDRERKEKALVRKIDGCMMPLMMLLCMTFWAPYPVSSLNSFT